MATLDDTLHVTAGDTDVKELQLDGRRKNDAGDFEDLPDLDEFSTGALYLQDENGTQHVDGGTVTVASSSDLRVEFDPAGQGPAGGLAFDLATRTVLRGYVLVTWTNGKTTRHPDPSFGPLYVVVEPSQE